MTKIEWTQRPGTKGETWNPIRATNKRTGGTGHFCVKVSAGCQNCYAADFQKRFNNKVRYAAQDADKVELFLDEIAILKPLHWKKPRTIFVCSMTDLFYDGHEDDWIDQVFAVMALCPQHTFIILTKRHDRMNAYFQKHFTRHKCGHIAAGITGKQHPGGHDCDPDVCNMHFPLPNVWIGVSIEDQKAANERIPYLLGTPAAVRFLSVEPLLGPIDLTDIVTPVREGVTDHFDALDHIEANMYAEEPDNLAALDWVIVGGESGHNARPMHPDWARSLRDQCKTARVPFFFKQWGAWAPADVLGITEDMPISDRHGNVRDWMNRYTICEDRADRLKAHSFTGHATNLVYHVGKKRAGRLLDGVEHNEWPTPANDTAKADDAA